MTKNVPYLASPGTITTTLKRIQSVPTPPKVTQDFVKTKLRIRGGSGNSMAAFLKKIGFVNADGSPSELYVKFRNSATAAAAAAQAFKTGYAPLYEHNEYMHDLPEKDIRGLIIEVTGCGETSRIIPLTLACIKHLRAFANFDTSLETSEPAEASDEANSQLPAPAIPPAEGAPPPSPGRKLGMNLGYTINLNLPASKDIAVFNAIFKSLKENLLRDIDEE